MSDIITNITLPGGENSNVNGGNATYKGVDMEYITDFYKYFSLRSSYSYVFEKPDTAFRASEYLASAVPNYKK